jgi:hypothetical protein
VRKSHGYGWYGHNGGGQSATVTGGECGLTFSQCCTLRESNEMVLDWLRRGMGEVRRTWSSEYDQWLH